MGFTYDTTEVKDDMKKYYAPAGEYVVKVISAEESDKMNKNREPYVKCTLRIIEPEEYNTVTIYHNVTFPAPTAKHAWFAKNWLKCCNQSFEGKVNVIPENWVGCLVRAELKIEESLVGDKTYHNNKVAYVTLDESLFARKSEGEEVPF